MSFETLNDLAKWSFHSWPNCKMALGEPVPSKKKVSNLERELAFASIRRTLL